MKTLILISCISFALAYSNTVDDRIVGGEVSRIEEAPYLVTFRFLKSHKCGASLISNKVVATAAHCTYGLWPNWMDVRIGSSYHNKDGVIIKVVNYTQHEDYDSRTMDNDISLLFLKEDALDVSPIAKVIRFQLYELDPGTIVTVYGWGRLSQGGESPEIMHKVDVALVDRESCRKSHIIDTVTDQMICTYSLSKDACQGDSGGPLVDVANNRLVGIVSWGRGCAKEGKPGVYTNIPALLPWIRKHMYDYE